MLCFECGNVQHLEAATVQYPISRHPNKNNIQYPERQVNKYPISEHLSVTNIQYPRGICGSIRRYTSQLLVNQQISNIPRLGPKLWWGQTVLSNFDTWREGVFQPQFKFGARVNFLQQMICEEYRMPVPTWNGFQKN